MIEKTLIERMNKKEYQKAIRSSIAATAMPQYVSGRHMVEGLKLPLIISDEIESISKTKDLMKILEAIGLSNDIEKSKDPQIKKGLRRSSARRHFRNTLLIVVKSDKGIIRAARNIPGVDSCKLSEVRASLLAPGGMPGRITMWSEDTIKEMSKEISKLSLM